MSADTYGTKGQPYFAAGGAPAIDVDPTVVSDYAAVVGNHIVGTTTERNANVVPGSSGKPVWDGLVWSDTTDGYTYKRVGGAWIPDAQVNYQADTTNTVRNARIQTGLGKVAGGNGSSISEAVTFPVAFSGVPVVTLSYAGARVNGAFNPAGLSGSNTGVGAAQVPSATGFIAALTGAGTYVSTNDYYYSWIAIGPA